jgi:hypothetical protein
MKTDKNTCQQQCANCRWSMPLEERYDQVFCFNEESPEAWGEVEATGCCECFES